jgi:hypothetical protein
MGRDHVSNIQTIHEGVANVDLVSINFDAMINLILRYKPLIYLRYGVLLPQNVPIKLQFNTRHPFGGFCQAVRSNS